MKNLVFLCLMFLLGYSIAFAQNIPSKEAQIKAAVQAAPEMYRDDAKVIGYDKEGAYTTLREGSNKLVCLADDPNEDGLSVACYSDKLESFMKRGRELTLEGKSNEEKQKIRKEEIDNGELEMPEEAAIVYVLSAEDGDFDAETGDIQNSKLRYVFYKPYMTVEETGLPDKPQGPGQPWLMDADTHRAHIMITPE